MTVTRSRIEASIPRKHGPAIAGYERVWSLCLLPLLQITMVHAFVNESYNTAVLILKHCPPFCRL